LFYAKSRLEFKTEPTQVGCYIKFIATEEGKIVELFDHTLRTPTTLLPQAIKFAAGWSAHSNRVLVANNYGRV
jgi:hypothetical protein